MLDFNKIIFFIYLSIQRYLIKKYKIGEKLKQKNYKLNQ